MTEKEFKTQLLPIQSKLFRLAVSFLNSRWEAKDIVQDVYARLWEMRHELNKYRNLEALAVTTTKNLCIDNLRSYRNRYQSKSGVAEKVTPVEANDPAQSAEVKESLQQVHEIIQQLSEQQRYILHLRGVEQYSYDEIEDVSGLTRNHIRVILSRARKKLKAEYKKR